jgi:glycosyltransferase involved in cell wall biosynthesis
MPARVLFVTHTADWIGPNVSLLELVIRLPDDLRAVVVVPGSGRFTRALEEDGVPFFSFRRLDKYGIPALISMIRREEISLVYGNSSHTASRSALVAAKLCGVPFVYHLREIARSDQRHRIRRLFSWADAAVAVSRATAESYRGSFREAPRVVYNGVSADRFNVDRVASRDAVASEFGIDKAALVVIQVGNVYERKGQRSALRVLRELLPTFPELRLLMVGRLDRDPAYVDSLRASIHEYGLEGRAIMTGLRTDVPKLLAASDVFLHTARRDPHPRAVIEAMAAGLPVVALAVDGVTETVVDNETGLLISWPCDPGCLAEPVARLLESPERRRAMGDRGRERTRRLFSVDRTTREVVDVIRGLLVPR